MTVKFLLSILVIINLCSCSASRITNFSRVSPDKSYRIDVQIKDRGALGSPKAEMYFINNVKKSREEIFTGDGGWPIDVIWLNSNEVVMVYCVPTEFSVKSSISTGDGLKDELNFHVITSKDMTLHGKQYCK